MSLDTYLLTLYVTVQQETAIRNLFNSKGWLFIRKEGSEWKVTEFEKDSSKQLEKEKGNDQDTVEKKKSDHKDKVEESGRVAYDSDNVDAGNDDIEDDNTNEEAETLATGTVLLSAEEIKTEFTDTSGVVSHSYEGETDDYDSAEDTNKSGRKRKKGQKTVSKKSKKAKRAVTKVPKKSGASTLPSETPVNETSEDISLDYRIVKAEDEDPSDEPVSTNLGLVDQGRATVEIELQETDDIDHYETVHKTLSPDEPYNPPSDVQETDGFSPSLGCYYCPDCGYTFQLEKWFKVHKWGGKCVYKCSKCSEVYTFRNISKYREHMKTHKWRVHQRKKVHKGIAPSHECDFCGAKFGTKYNKDRHYRVVHLEMKRFPCSTCDQKFATNLSLIGHMLRDHSKGSQLSCEKCGKKFIYSHNLKEHVTRCGIKPQHECKKCGKMFSTGRSLQLHFTCKHERKSFVCELCGRDYQWNASLWRHKQDKHQINI